MSTSPLSTIFVRGVAHKDVDPDRFRVHASLEAEPVASSDEAMMQMARRRRTLVDELRTAFPDAEIDDSNVSVNEHQVRKWFAHSQTTGNGSSDDPFADPSIQGRTSAEGEWRYVHAGYRASCRVSVSADAAQASAVLAAVASSTAQASVQSPDFTLSRALRRKTHLSLVAESVHAARTEADRLAEAALLKVQGVASIGEEPPTSSSFGGGGEYLESADYAMRASVGSYSAQDISEELGEIRPRPITVTVNTPVRFVAG